ncbi:MAG: ABC transporter ATP-binding protein [Bernardetiaceae bacterium]|nr:ABC transporter ATP-binding protein [Bernardetiaceae bacterium]
MRIFRRLISYLEPLHIFIPVYFVVLLLGVIFGAANFTLLIPLLDLLFGTSSISTDLQAAPDFSFSISYIKESFQYHFITYSEANGKVATLWFVCSILIITVFFSNFFRYIGHVMVNRKRLTGITALRKALFEHVMRLPAAYFSNERKGDLMARLSSDVREVEVSVYNQIKVVIKEPITAVVYIGLLLFISWELMFFSLIFLTLAGGLIGTAKRQLRRTGREVQGLSGDLLNTIEESLSGIKIIQAFTAERFILGRFFYQNDAYRKVATKNDNKRDLASPLSEFLGVATLAGIVIYGGSLVLSEESTLSASAFVAYAALFSQVIPPLQSALNGISTMQRGLASGERILAIMDTIPDITSPQNPIHIKSFEREISLQNVCFAYDEKMVLDKLNLDIPKGKTIALVGPSGGGKSTVADLIPRFYDPIAGQVMIDGIDIKDVALEDLRQLMGVVTQEAILFNDTIFNNIAFGISKASEEDVIKAAKIANAHDFIMQTEAGYQTNIGDRGSKLSGGQRQRISIARAVLKNPPILILDEATSALDSESEKLVQEALENLMKNRTSLVIAHRLSTIQHADKIIVLQEGKVIEAGTHHELLKQEGAYHKLLSMQNMKS